MAMMHYGGLLTGRMGDKVFYIQNGKQMVRMAHTAVTNPRTPAQMRQRERFVEAQRRVHEKLETNRAYWEQVYQESEARKKGGTLYSWLMAQELREAGKQDPDKIPTRFRQVPNKIPTSSKRVPMGEGIEEGGDGNGNA